jgi:antitoxin (DNA-binding transcriptional repressor) of toxin-antitoxin stability system
MRQASVRDLRYSFKDVEALLATGEEIEIVKRKKVIARLVPVEPPKPPYVDFQAQLEKLWGDERPDISLVDLISEGRGEY